MRARFPVPVILALLCALIVTACSGNDEGTSRSRPTEPNPTTSRPSTTGAGSARPLADLKLKLTKVADLEQPDAIAVRSGDDALYIVEKSGRLRVMRNGRVAPRPVLDIEALVQNSGEQGFLGAAFSPDGSHLYVNYTDKNGDGRIVEYAMRGDRADAATRRELIFLDDPFPNHNGGNLVFGPDRMLWIGMGDSGSAGDPNNNAQSLGTLFGKMLRIDPRPSGDRPYTIPPDNPFVGRAGARPEIWSYGFRNPWRYSFDRQTGDLWIGDVGQNAWEEVDFVAAGSRGGENFGWSLVEGNHRFKGAAPPGAVAPIHEYANGGDAACAVTGGYVYRGTRIPALTGAYLFADYCGGRVMGLRERDGRQVELADLGLHLDTVDSFGEDARGELYALSLTGEVARIDPA